MKIGLGKWKNFGAKNFFSEIVIPKSGVNEFSNQNEKYASDPKIGFSAKSILKSFGPTSPIRQLESSNDIKKIAYSIFKTLEKFITKNFQYDA